MSICKACGFQLREDDYGVAYCPMCKAKKRRPCPEIDKETGSWEGMY